ncbi:MAG: hypothetical protein PHY79_19295 [Anaerolineae bacterium]|nr:hypothetical protein [Anaerolineae bacterium]
MVLYFFARWPRKDRRAPIDDDEFAAAVLAYGYSPEFQAACYRVAHAAAALLKAWTPLLPPATSY